MPKKKGGAKAKRIAVRIRKVPIEAVPILKLVAKTIVPWETDAMKKHDRVLQFGNIGQGQPIQARCSTCQRIFIGKPRPNDKKNDKTDDILLRIRAEFEAHNCQQDAGQ